MKTTVMILVVLMVAGPAMSATLGYWKYEGDMTDSSGNNRHGTAVHAMQDGTPIAPNPYTPVYDNDVPLLAPTPNTSSLIISATYDDNKYMVAANPIDMTGSSITVEFYAKISAGDDWWVAVAKDRTHQTTCNEMPPWWIEHDPRRGWVFGMSDGTLTGKYRLDSGIHAGASAWTHVAGTYDADTDIMRLYVDGTLAAWAVNPIGLMDYETAFLAGAKAYGNPVEMQPYSYTPHGNIDEYRISDVALDRADFLPEPATAGLLCVGGLMALLRRRRK